ncbi:hypothetical protein K501DRAFT_95530, partial [Backusella circina FSU 941]
MIDPSSLANLSQVVTKHIHLDWNISFDEKKISGHILLDMLTCVPDVKEVILDTSYLDLKSVEVNGEEVKYTVAERHLSLGSALTIPLPETIEKEGTAFQVKVVYSTTDKCTSVQYLEPEQTVGKKFPYLF